MVRIARTGIVSAAESILVCRSAACIIALGVGCANSAGVGGAGAGGAGVAGSSGGDTFVPVESGGMKTESGGSVGSGAVVGTSATSGAGNAGAPPAAGATGSGGTAGSSGAAGSNSTAGSGGSAAVGGRSGGSAGSVDGGAGKPVSSAGCGKTPMLKNSPAAANQNTLTVSGTSRQFLIRWPSNYDNRHPYRLILGFHGAGGKDTDIGPSYFGLFELSSNTTIFVAPSANGGMWNATTDSLFVDQILSMVQADLCIDTSRIELEGFSQGGAMVAVLACGRPGVFRAAVGHSRGGLTAPASCEPIPYLGSLGLHDISGNSQATQTDAFAKWDGCTIDMLPTAPTGGHLCTPYKGCAADKPVIWCSFDGPHTASPTDSGKGMSWMPSEVWSFLSGF